MEGCFNISLELVAIYGFHVGCHRPLVGIAGVLETEYKPI